MQTQKIAILCNDLSIGCQGLLQLHLVCQSPDTADVTDVCEVICVSFIQMMDSPLHLEFGIIWSDYW